MQNTHLIRFSRRGFAALFLVLVAAPFVLTRAASAADPLKVVCTLPDLADITRVIGGDRVEVSTLYKGKENTHALTGKPSHLVALSRADVFVQIGLSLESGFVPGLLENCRNAKIAPGKPGFVNVSEGFRALDVPTALTRKDGDIHPQGNPHMNLDPRAGMHMARVIHDHLVEVDPGSKAGYDERFALYSKKLEEASVRWTALGKDWKAKRIVVYHKEYNYLADAYGLVIQGSIESKPGIPPTPNHIAGLVETMKQEPGAPILTALWSNNDTVSEIARATGARIVELPNMCGGLTGAESWIGMMDLIHERLTGGFKPQGDAR
ncbi:MAG: zinc ABC transporter substrate-binding protein [Planctomycetes bacterium]|nr:zinc ABC transporter substrate-binding protein [Planctomycetota bacterium]